VFCTAEERDATVEAAMLHYLSDYTRRHTGDYSVFQVRSRESDAPMAIDGKWKPTLCTLDQLLDELIDLNDYRRSIRERIETDKLPNSDRTLLDMYTAARTFVGSEDGPPLDLELMFENGLIAKTNDSWLSSANMEKAKALLLSCLPTRC
jgi:hypothetical protein